MSEHEPKNYTCSPTHHRLSKVGAADGLGQDGRDVDDLNLVALCDIVRLGDRVGDDELLHAALRDDLERGAREDAVGDKGVDLGRARLEEVAGREAEGATRVGHVVDQDRDLALDGTDKDHARDLVGAFALLVEEGKLDVEAVGNRRGALGATSIWRDNDTVLDIQVLADIVDHGGLCVELDKVSGERGCLHGACRIVAFS